MTKKSFFAAIIGNLFEHYDNALFGLLAPFIAPLFFPQSSPLSALILTYGMLALGLISKPLGALVFGYIGDTSGRKKALYISLVGMAIVTCLMGFLPTYELVGIAAPIMLAFCRFFQSFFAAGETTGGPIFILEQAGETRRSFLSGLYDCSSIIGIFLASGVVTLFAFFQTEMATLWRIPFFLGSFCGLMGVWLRIVSIETLPPTAKRSLPNHLHSIWQHKAALVPIILVTGFSYAVYAQAFTFMNGFLPFVSEISKQKASNLNTLLLLLDLALLPLFGLVAGKWGKEKLMIGSALALCLLAVPSYLLLQEATLVRAGLIRITLVTLGVAFAAPYHHWALEQVPQLHRYTLLGLGKAIGSQTFGAPSAAISLWLYQKTGWTFAPSLYLMATALGALIPITLIARRRSQANLQV